MAAVALVGTMLGRSKKSTKQVVTTGLRQTPGGHPDYRPIGPSQMWVDTAVNTNTRNDTIDRSGLVAKTFAEIDDNLRMTYLREAASHPGVRLVAGQAVA